VIGGHLNQARISVTCEMFIHILDGQVDREKDPETGINLLKF
jgi:predicted DNA-binding protein with PD1-like motif